MISTGAAYPVAIDVYDGTGAPANAATVTLTITLPDGTTVTPAVTNPPAVTGKYRYAYLTTMAGHHAISMVTTNPDTAWGDSFNARDFHSIISLTEAKQHLSGGDISTWTADDDELRNFMQASTELIESKAGPCVRRTLTQRVDDRTSGGWRTLVLNQRPVISVTSVTSVWANGPQWTTSQLVTDSEAGTVTTQLGTFYFWYGPWDVVYVAGRAVIPERLIQAQKELLRHMWESQRGSTPLLSPLGGEGETFTSSTGLTFTVPNRVLEMLNDDMLPSV